MNASQTVISQFKMFGVVTICLLTVTLLIACNRGAPSSSTPSEAVEATPSLIDKVAAAATAEASATSTIMVDYLDEVAAAKTKWDAADVTNYQLELSYNEGQGGFQQFLMAVEDNVVTEFKHTCTPERTCLRVQVEDEQQFTINGIFATLDNLGQQQIPLAILRFDDTNGAPLAITTNSDESPVLRMYRVENLTISE